MNYVYFTVSLNISIVQCKLMCLLFLNTPFLNCHTETDLQNFMGSQKDYESKTEQNKTKPLSLISASLCVFIEADSITNFGL